MRIYLCGSVAGRSAKEVREEREAVAEALHKRGWMAVDPIAGEYDALKRRRKIGDTDSGLTAVSIARKDQYQIDHVDMLLWLTASTASYGSCIEIGYAWARGVPIIAVDPERRGRKSAFVEHCCTYIADDLEDALDFMANYLLLPGSSGG